MKKMPKIAMPAGLDKEARRKFREMVPVCDPDCDKELLANFCRQFSLLISIRRERAKQEAAGIFSTMVAGRDATQTINPLITSETRAIGALNRMLKLLGLTPAQEQAGRGRKPLAEPPPPGFPRDAKEPEWGWQIERALCGDAKDFLPGGKYGTKN